MDTHTMEIWQRGGAWKIMMEARKRFREAEARGDYAGASTELASTHFSLVKRYLAPKPKRWRSLAAWHMFWALWHADRVVTGLMPRTFDQVDVVSNILSKTPKCLERWSWFKGNKETARALILSALNEPRLYEDEEMSPHTRALLLLTLSQIEWELGNIESAWGACKEAVSWLPDILRETSDDREMQAVRVMKKAGLFFYDYGDRPMKNSGVALLEDAYRLASSVALDQKLEIERECRFRGIALQVDE